MKKLLLCVAALTLGVSTFVNAQTTLSITDLLKDASFGYDAQNRVAVESIETTAIHLRSPIIKYYNGDLILIYRLTYSPYLIEDLANTSDPAILDQIHDKEITLTNGTDRVMLNLGVEDGLDPNKTYYAMVTPVDIYDDIGTSSDQICFNLSQEKYDVGNNCLSFEGGGEVTHRGEVDNQGEHGAGSNVDLALANISHTVMGNTISFKWVAIDGVDGMDIFLFDRDQDSYVRLKEVKMSDEKFDYTMKRDGEHIFTFKPLNGGKEIVYNVNAMKSEEAPEKPTIPTPPATGPVENTLLILALSGLIYLGYRRYRLKAER